MTPAPGTPCASPCPRRGTLAAARSYGVGIVRPGRCVRGGASVASDTGIVTSRRQLCTTCNQVTGRKSRLSDTVTCPTVMPLQASPDPGSSRVGTGRDGRWNSINSSRTLGNPAQTHEAPTRGLFWSTTAEGGSNHESQGEGMSRSREECIRGGGWVATPEGVSKGEDGLTVRGAL